MRSTFKTIPITAQVLVSMIQSWRKILDKQTPYQTTNSNSLPNDKILDSPKLKAFADDKMNLNEKLKVVLGREENIVRKEENAGDQHFLLFPQCFQKPSLSGLLKVGIVWLRVKTCSN